MSRSFGERDDVLGIGVASGRRIAGLRRHADIFRHDLDAVGGGDRLGGKGVAEALGIDIMQRGDLHIAVGGEHRAGVAHHLLDLVGRQRALFVEGRVRSGSRRSSGSSRFRPWRHRSARSARQAAGRRRLRRRLRADRRADSCASVLWPAASAILICTNGTVRMTSRSPTLVTVETSSRRRSLAGRSGAAATGRSVLASSPDLVGLGQIEQVGDFRRGRQLLAPVQSGEQRHAHQHAGGDAGEEGSRQPAGRNLAAIGRAAAAIRNQRRLVAEIGYGVVAGLHSERRCFHVPEPLLSWPEQLPVLAGEVNERRAMPEARARRDGRARASGSAGPHGGVR